MQILEQVSLQPYNTLNCAVSCDFFVEIRHIEELLPAQQFAEARKLPLLILGGGSNIVLTEDFHGLIMKIALRGVHIATQRLDDGRVKVTAAAGENWDELVSLCLNQRLCGLENLSLIPGSVGAAPIQNIGAYGVELAELLISVSVWDLAAKRLYSIAAADCELAYRDSVFKHGLRDRVVITGIELGLHVIDPATQTNIAYQALSEYFGEMRSPAPEEVRRAVIAVRQSKLPDPKLAPNVGSFFKNPVVSAEEFQRLRQAYPDLPSFPQTDGSHKLPAAWLIDQRGWKGRQRGAVGVHDQQALVLVNRAIEASGAATLELAQTIQEDIKRNFGVALEIEPRVY